METGEAEGGAVLFVAEARMEAEGTKDDRPAANGSNQEFPFESFLIAGFSRAPSPLRWAIRRRGFRRQNDTTPTAGRGAGGCGSLDAEPKQKALATEITGRGVVNRILLQDASPRNSAQGVKIAEKRHQIGDGEFDLDFTTCTAAMRHAKV